MAKEIQLTKGKVTIVDDEDFEYLNQWKWSTNSAKPERFYAWRNKRIDGKVSMIYLHRFILNITDRKIYVDHINNNSLDNRKVNLRQCSHSENERNKDKTKRNSSGFKGVCFDKSCNKFFSLITVNRKRIWLGYFIDPIDAAKVYNEAALKYHGEFAKLNEI
jgi:hypothetical protein